MSTPDGEWNWPNGSVVAVSLSFDVDGETVWLSDPQYKQRLSRLSEGRYGINRGMPRILELFERYELKGTFFVPGNTALMHPHLVPLIMNSGHEVGHHGHMHLTPSFVSTDDQRAEIEQGLASLEQFGVSLPIGYRSPSWELTPTTLDLLVEYGFSYDSSCMADDRPYLEQGTDGSLLELPVYWSWEDWPRFAYTVDRGGNVGSEEELLVSWLGEYQFARAEGQHITFTLHPDVMGRPYRLLQLEKLIDKMREDGDVWIAPLRDVAAHVVSQLPETS